LGDLSKRLGKNTDNGQIPGKIDDLPRFGADIAVFAKLWLPRTNNWLPSCYCFQESLEVDV
jgi:hypothetical protein